MHRSGGLPGSRERAGVLTVPPPRLGRSTMAALMPLVPPVTRRRLPWTSAASRLCDAWCMGTSSSHRKRCKELLVHAEHLLQPAHVARPKAILSGTPAALFEDGVRFVH